MSTAIVSLQSSMENYKVQSSQENEAITLEMVLEQDRI